MNLPATQSLLRASGGAARVSNAELFFDLVFAFAVTQLSHDLLQHLSTVGALRTALLFLAVWWAWIYTSWVTNWLDPERTPVRLLLFVLMLAALMMSAAIPRAFADRGLVFAGAYVFIQVGRSLFVIWAIGDASPGNRRNFQRITLWLGLSGVFWIAGGVCGGEVRALLWLVAIGIEYAGPLVGFRVPGLGFSMTNDWDIHGGHLAERCSQFIIIALGESLLVTGATLAGLTWSPLTFLAFATAVVGSVAMWWIYFDTGAERGSASIVKAGDPGRLGRSAYTYFHLVIVAGIIVAAVADELVLAHPSGRAGAATRVVFIGGATLYLVGNILFKRAVTGRLPLSHALGLALMAGLAIAAPGLAAFALNAAVTAVLIFVAAWETVSLRVKR